ncbi:MAG: hypothetical protein AMJ55_02950 [Gammaproteobacteria bacterium SG8_15]|nr:MAG: hypothetical protein AMJ55_02950 [Gammaproteobacteria bacterium SG8_15]
MRLFGFKGHNRKKPGLNPYFNYTMYFALCQAPKFAHIPATIRHFAQCGGEKCWQNTRFVNKCA